MASISVYFGAVFLTLSSSTDSISFARKQWHGADGKPSLKLHPLTHIWGSIIIAQKKTMPTNHDEVRCPISQSWWADIILIKLMMQICMFLSGWLRKMSLRGRALASDGIQFTIQAPHRHFYRNAYKQPTQDFSKCLTPQQHFSQPPESNMQVHVCTVFDQN